MQRHQSFKRFGCDKRCISAYDNRCALFSAEKILGLLHSMTGSQLRFLQYIFSILAYISFNCLCAVSDYYNLALASGRFYGIKHMPYHRFAADGVQYFI
ncbi:hypothetical protein D3C81_1533530 [compost metagenome]